MKSSKKSMNNLPTGDRLVALPVAGDAFLLVRDGDSVLVDGGKSGKRLYKELKLELQEPIYIRRIICTHNDDDHAKGLAEMLEKIHDFTVDELWLPGSWADGAKKIIKGQVYLLAHMLFNDIARMLVNDKCVSLSKILSMSTAEILFNIEDDIPQSDDAYFEYLKTAENQHQRNQRFGNKNEDVGARYLPLFKQFRKISRTINYRERQLNLFKRIGADCLDRVGRNNRKSIATTREAVALYRRLISTLGTIQRIAVAAIHRKAIIRWFDAEAYYLGNPKQACGGDLKNLIPLNSIELVTPPPVVNLTYSLFLTQVNKHSLNFWAPEEKDFPGCVFSADGLLDGDALCPTPSRPQVFTAPHHGSESNKSAYSEIPRMIGINGKWPTDSILLRSDINTIKNPCGEFKRTANRFCTVCPKKKQKYQKISLSIDAQHKTWHLASSPNASKCDCR